MKHRSWIAFVIGSVISVTTAGPLLGQTNPATGGTPAEAKAMLERAVQAVKADKQRALAAFSLGTDGFRQGDLYVFCIGPDGKVDAHPNPELIGVDARGLSDKNGKHFAVEMLNVAQPGTFAEVTYSWPRLLGAEPIPKTSFVTKVDDQVCGVGYYH